MKHHTLPHRSLRTYLAIPFALAALLVCYAPTVSANWTNISGGGLLANKLCLGASTLTTCGVYAQHIDNESIRFSSPARRPQITLGSGLTLAQGLTANSVAQANGIRADNFWANGTIRVALLCLGGAASANDNGLGDCKSSWPVSDARLKHDVDRISSALDRVLALRGVSYKWIDENRNVDKVTGSEVGLIAQEVMEVFPEVVHKDLVNDRYWIEYGQLVGPLVEAIREQQSIIEEQQSQIDGLRAEIEAIKAQL